MTHKIKWLLATPVIAATGCATIINGETQDISINTSPAGANVYVDAKPIGKSPLVAQVKRKDGTVIRVEHPDYKTEEIHLKTTSSAFFFGNILFGGLPGTTTDVATGAAIQYEKDSYYVALAPAGKSAFSDESKEGRLKNYIVGNYNKIFQEAVSGHGENLNVLFSLLAIEPRSLEIARTKILELANDIASPPEFADAVVDTFSRPPYGSP